MRFAFKFWSIFLFILLRSAQFQSLGDDSQDDGPLNSTTLSYQQFESENYINNSKANDNLKPVVDRLQKIARITNGVYLLQGLASGKIPSDELISELLFLESSNFPNFSKLIAAINTVQNIPAMLASTGETNKVEAGLKELENLIKKTNGIKKLSNFDGDHFKQEISRMAGNGINTGIFTIVGAFAFSWGNEYNSVFTGNPPVSQSTFDEIKSALTAIKTRASTIEQKIKDWNFDNFGKLMDGVALLTKTANGTNIINTSSQTLSDAEVQSYIQYVETEAKKTKELDTSLIADFREVMTKLVMRPRTRSLQHTHGLSNGSPDFVQMLDDVNDKWIKKLIRTDELQIQFKRLTNVSNAIKGMDDSLHFVKEDRRNIILILEYGRLVDKATNIEQLKRNAFKMCSTAQLTNIQSDEFIDFRKNLKQMDDKFSMLKTQTKLFSEALLTPGLDKMCDEVISIINGASDIPTATKHLKEYKQLEALNSIIQKLATSFNSIIDNALSTFAVNLNTTITVFDGFLQYLKSYSEYFECLRYKYELKSLIELVGDIETIRSLNRNETFNNTIEAGLNMVNKVRKVSEAMKTLNTTLDEMKGEEVFKELNDGSVHSKIIGLSVGRISNMDNALKQKAVVMKALEKLPVLKAYRHLMFGNEDVMYLNYLLGLEEKISNMYESLDEFSRVAKDSELISVMVHSGVFEQALSVTGINEEYFPGMNKLVGRLKEQISDPEEKKKLGLVEQSLEIIESMGLDLSSYGFHKTKMTLRVLENFFIDLEPQFYTPGTRNDKLYDKIMIIVGTIIVVFLLVEVGMEVFHPSRKRVRTVYPSVVLLCYKKRRNRNAGRRKLRIVVDTSDESE